MANTNNRPDLTDEEYNALFVLVDFGLNTTDNKPQTFEGDGITARVYQRGPRKKARIQRGKAWIAAVVIVLGGLGAAKLHDSMNHLKAERIESEIVLASKQLSDDEIFYIIENSSRIDNLIHFEREDNLAKLRKYGESEANSKTAEAMKRYMDLIAAKQEEILQAPSEDERAKLQIQLAEIYAGAITNLKDRFTSVYGGKKIEEILAYHEAQWYVGAYQIKNPEEPKLG